MDDDGDESSEGDAAGNSFFSDVTIAASYAMFQEYVRGAITDDGLPDGTDFVLSDIRGD